MKVTTPRRLALAATSLTAVLATSACGGQSLTEDSADEGADDGGTAAVEEFTPEPAPDEDLAKDVIDAVEADPALTAALPERIREEGLQMTTSEGYPPMEMFATDGETLIGLDPSLGRAIANKLGVDIEIANEDFNAQIPGITTGRYDIIMSSMTDNAERRETVTFVDYVAAGNGWVVQAGNPSGMGAPDTACGKTVAVVDNGSSLNLAEGFSQACEEAGSEPLEILKFSGDQEAILQVRNGRADAGINDYPVAAYRASTSEGDLEAVEIEGEKSPWGIAMNPDNADLIDAVQQALQALIDEGSYEDILGAWDVEAMAVDSAVLNDGN